MNTESALPSRIDKYEILGVIGRGGMGVVYKARDPHIDRVVAIKTIRTESSEDSDQVARLRMEARSAGKLQHPNIVTIFDFGEQNDLSYIVMEFIEGINLSRVMQKRKPIPLRSKIDVIMQVARGLAYAHEKGVIHRDMKPSNIAVTPRGVAKILDFGLARYDDTKMTKTGYLSGTIAYMSPERFSGETGPADDIFSMGAVAYEFLTLQRAFPGATTPEVISKILGGSVPPPVSQLSGYPTALDEIVDRAMRRDPIDRYRNASDFEVALLEFLRSSEFTAFSDKEFENPDFPKTVDWSDESSKSTVSPYSSAPSMSDVAMGDAPTLQVVADESTRERTEMLKAPVADPTILTTKPASDAAPTQINFTTVEAHDTDETLRVPPKRRRNGLVGVIAAAGLIGIVAAALFLRDGAPDEPSKTEPPPPRPGVTNETAARQSELQLATASTLGGAVAQRQLSATDQTRFTDANRQLDDARQKVEQGDYAAGAALISQATQTMRDLLAAPPLQTATAATTTTTASGRKRTTTPVKPTVIATATTATVAPPPVTETQRVPEPQPQSVTPRGPTRAELERDINSFIRAIANAYQEKDVAFFRQRSLRFNDQLAGAIRNSPSTRVDIAVREIQFTDENNAKVTVRRTDTFAEARMPAGVQNLVYELRRTEDGWKIVAMSRQ